MRKEGWMNVKEVAEEEKKEYICKFCFVKNSVNVLIIHWNWI